MKTILNLLVNIVSAIKFIIGFIIWTPAVIWWVLFKRDFED